MKYCSQSSKLEAAIRTNAKPLTDWLERKLGDRPTAEDVAQNVFLTVWIRARSSKIENPGALIFKVARDLTNNEYKRRARAALQYSAHNVEEDLCENIHITLDNPEKTVVSKQELENILIQIEKLPANLRCAFKMNRFSEMNYVEIADHMGVSVSSIEKYIMKSLQTLRNTQNSNLPDPRRVK